MADVRKYSNMGFLTELQNKMLVECIFPVNVTTLTKLALQEIKVSCTRTSVGSD